MIPGGGGSVWGINNNMTPGNQQLKFLAFNLFHFIGESERAARDTRPPPLGPISFIFMQFSGKIGPNNKGLVPIHLGNHGSATAFANRRKRNIDLLVSFHFSYFYHSFHNGNYHISMNTGMFLLCVRFWSVWRHLSLDQYTQNWMRSTCTIELLLHGQHEFCDLIHSLYLRVHYI